MITLQFTEGCFFLHLQEAPLNIKTLFMKKLLNLFLFISVNLIAISCNQKADKKEENGYESLRNAFVSPSGTALPKVYWWCLNGNIDTLKAREEFTAMKNAGIGGFDMFEIGARSKDIPAGPAFLSDESLKIIRFVAGEAGKLGLTMGLHVASSWNAGGAWIEAKNGGKSLYKSEIKVSGNSSVQKIKLPFPEINFPKSALIGGTGKSLIPLRPDGRPEYYEEIAVLAIPEQKEKNSLDVSEIIDVTRYFNSETGELTWEAPSGNWQVNRYVCSNSGQQLVLPSPYSAGLVIDHFDSTAVRTHFMYVIRRLQTVLGDFRKTALKSLYLASYEARGFVWSSRLADDFRKLNGYDIISYLPVFFDADLFSKEVTDRVKTDFKKTLSEMMINNLYKNARRICNSYGLQINCEAGGPGYPLYNGPAEPLKALGALDLPRGEFWVEHPRYYKDANGIDSIDLMQVVKEVAAASHIYKRKFVEEESFTSFRHWMEGPYDLRPIGDRAFCEGLNRVVFHGFTHNPEGTGFPGIVYHAGTHMNTKRVWWPKAKPFFEYIARLSSVFQEGNFYADVVFYYGDKIPNAATPKNSHFKAGPGFDYEVINTEILLDDLTFKDGKLALSNGARFSLLALENEEAINPDVLHKLQKLAKSGAVIIGEKPKRTVAIEGNSYSGPKGQKLINRLWTEAGDPADLKPEAGKIYSGIKPQQMLSVLGLQSDIDYRDKETYLIDYIHYSKGKADAYFIRNTSGKTIIRDLGFRQSSVPEIWDPANGEIIPVTVYRKDGDYTRIPVTLASYESYLVVFGNREETPHYTAVSSSEQDPDPIIFTKDGVLTNVSCEFSGPSGSVKVQKEDAPVLIEGPWKVSFSEGWGAPQSATFKELISWTDHNDRGIKYYSGTGRYYKTFSFEGNIAPENERIFIDLGDISEIGEAWLNGKSLGITWTKPFRFDVTGIIRNGRNELEVEVANTWCNRIIGDALTGENYTSTNITNVDGKPWTTIPLNPSGLLGPVSIGRVNLVR
jgi:hypothetical protein